MQAGASPDTSPSPVPSPEWLRGLADLLAATGTERLPSALRHLLHLACQFDSMLVSVFNGRSAPLTLYHDLDEMAAAISVDFYASGPYLLDPFYLACRNEVAPGAYLLLNLAPDGFLRSNYYATFYRKLRIFDEMALLLRRAPGNWIVISLARTQTRQRFSVDDRDRMNRIFPLAEAAVTRTWPEGEGAAPALMAADRFDSFARDVLSRREAEVVQLILQGHSTPVIAKELGIAEGTVKVHRHHAYAKLGIRSQSELFSLAMRHLIDTGG